MILRSISADGLPPIRNLSMESLGGVVIIAGANGSGKSRLKQAIVETFRNPGNPIVNLEIEATRPEESVAWGGRKSLSIRKSAGDNAFNEYMNTRTRGGAYTGTLIQIDSDRAIRNLQFQQISLATPDPDDEEIDNRWFMSEFGGRWNQVVNRIHMRVANRGQKIAQWVISNPQGKSTIEALKKFPDPFVPYQELFSTLLPGKTLLEVDPKSPQDFRYKTSDGLELGFSTLSSGEQEIIKVTFDLLAKKITHCVFLIDEPELHLHPTLAFRLIETLKQMGKGTNQFIFFTHSADLISTYYSTGNVFFIDSDPKSENQAHRLSELDESHTSLVRAMGENLGLFAVGKRLIFVEGEHASRDRPTYNALAQRWFPDSYVVPAGFADGLMALDRFGVELKKTVFGIDFFMIRDRDGLDDVAVRKLESGGRIRCLARRHIENYFLDAEVLAMVAAHLYLPDAALKDQDHLEAELKKIAEQALVDALALNFKEAIRVRRNVEIPNVKNVQSKSVTELEDSFVADAVSKAQNFSEGFTEVALRGLFKDERLKLEESLKSDEWKRVFPGKLIYQKFCGNVLHMDAGQVREAYVDIALQKKPVVFEDIKKILQGFRKLTGE